MRGRRPVNYAALGAASPDEPGEKGGFNTFTNLNHRMEKAMRYRSNPMVMPSTSGALVVIAIFAALSTLNWFIGGLAYRCKGTPVEGADTPRHGVSDSIKDAA
jgi:hypothetical protein